MIYQFTHNDLDGIMSALVAQFHYLPLKMNRPTKIRYESTCSYGTIDSSILYALDNFDDIEHILITDLTPSEHVLERLKNESAEGRYTVEVIDHHLSASHLQEIYPFITNYETHDDGKATSATSMVLDAMDKTGIPYHMSDGMRLVIEAVREYDTWDWTKTPDSPLTKEVAQKLNEAVYLLGIDQFVDFMVFESGEVKHHPVELFGTFLNKLLDNQIAKAERYVTKSAEHAQFTDLTIDGQTYHVGYVAATSNLSEVGNAVAKLPNVDFAVVINGVKVSLRASEESTADLSVIAKAFNGGGHIKAAGGRLNMDYEEILQSTINE